jgi:hypothetical protein
VLKLKEEIAGKMKEKEKLLAEIQKLRSKSADYENKCRVLKDELNILDIALIRETTVNAENAQQQEIKNNQLIKEIANFKNVESLRKERALARRLLKEQVEELIREGLEDHIEEKIKQLIV